MGALVVSSHLYETTIAEGASDDRAGAGDTMRSYRRVMSCGAGGPPLTAEVHPCVSPRRSVLQMFVSCWVEGNQ
jgi:hypothetical protein